MLKPYLKYIYFVGVFLIIMTVSNAFVTWQTNITNRYAYKNPRTYIFNKTITIKTETRSIEDKKDIAIDSRITKILPDGSTEIEEKGIKVKSNSKTDENINTTDKKDSKNIKTPVFPTSREIILGINYLRIGEDNDLFGVNGRFNFVDNFYIGAGIYSYADLLKWDWSKFGSNIRFGFSLDYRFK